MGQGGRADDRQGRSPLCNPEGRHRGERRRAEDVVVGEELAGHGGLRTQRLAGTQLKAQLVPSAASVIQRNASPSPVPILLLVTSGHKCAMLPVITPTLCLFCPRPYISVIHYHPSSNAKF